MKKRISSEQKPALTILVPVYNEEKTILDILQRVTKLPITNYEVLIVNDASKDRSLAIIENFLKTHRDPKVAVRLYSHEKNRGKGAGIKTGLSQAKGEYFVVQDADLEYDPADIPKLLAHAQKYGCPVVYGSRFKGQVNNMPWPNFMANRFYNFLLRRLYRTQITDMHTCYKMARTDLLKSYNLTSEGFGYATELVSKILRQGIEIAEVPIGFHGRTRKEGKKIGIADGIECTKMILKYRFGTES